MAAPATTTLAPAQPSSDRRRPENPWATSLSPSLASRTATTAFYDPTAIDPLAQLSSSLTLPPTVPDLSLSAPTTGAPGPQIPELPRLSIALNLDAGALAAALSDDDALATTKLLHHAGAPSSPPSLPPSQRRQGGVDDLGTVAGEGVQVNGTHRAASTSRISFTSASAAVGQGASGFFRSLTMKSNRSRARSATKSSTQTAAAAAAAAAATAASSSPSPPSSPPASPVPSTVPSSEAPSLMHQALTGTGWFSPMVADDGGGGGGDGHGAGSGKWGKGKKVPPTREAKEEAERRRPDKLKSGAAAPRSARRPGLAKRFSSGVSLKHWTGDRGGSAQPSPPVPAAPGPA